MRGTITLLALTLLVPASASAQEQTRAGPIIHSAGAVFSVPSPSFATRTDQEYKTAFELAAAASAPDRLNVSLNTVARYLNMHAQAGVPVEKIHAAVVVHGPSGWEMVNDEVYRERFGVPNPNTELIRELTSTGTRVILCGQTAASRGIPTDMLIEGVDVALSAMTAFAILQEEGYRVNPW